MSYSAKISRTGGSVKNLFVTGKDETKSDLSYFCVEDNEFNPDLYSLTNHAEINSDDDILSAWLDGLAEEVEQDE
ncbi:MAG: hypothetical protein RBR53_06095 [Desulforegulaceae bacterium]|nr:hypothetical protein [Desulforegulaceae bacterium]